MGKIIYCSDLVVRVDDEQDVSNITEWILSSMEFKPAYPDGCVVRSEMSTMGKLSVIMGVWAALIVLTTFYCYFCEQRLFPQQKLAESCAGCEKASSTTDLSTAASSPINGSFPSSPTLEHLSSSLSNTDSFKSQSSSSQSSLLSPSLSCHDTKVCILCGQLIYLVC